MDFVTQWCLQTCMDLQFFFLFENSGMKMVSYFITFHAWQFSLFDSKTSIFQVQIGGIQTLLRESVNFFIHVIEPFTEEFEFWFVALNDFSSYAKCQKWKVHTTCDLYLGLILDNFAWINEPKCGYKLS